MGSFSPTGKADTLLMEEHQDIEEQVTKLVQLWRPWIRYLRNFLAQLFNVLLCILNMKKLIGNSELCQAS